jgi:ubiquitin C-terminal hydrolase
MHRKTPSVCTQIARSHFLQNPERLTALQSLREQHGTVSHKMAQLSADQLHWKQQIDDCFKPLDTQNVYQLFAVMIHDGKTAGQGHYWAYVKRVEDGQWMALNDANTSFVDEKKVWSEATGGVPGKNASAYFLIYINAQEAKRAAAPGYAQSVDAYACLLPHGSVCCVAHLRLVVVCAD